jgi:hypothetical protein
MKLELKPGVSPAYFWTSIAIGLGGTAATALSLTAYAWAATAAALIALIIGFVRGNVKPPPGSAALLLLLLPAFLLSSCSFYERHQATLDAIVIDAAHIATDAALRKITREAKQPQNVQPLKSADDADSEGLKETILEGLEPTAPVCEEPRGEALPACLKLTPRVFVPRYGVQVAAALSR